MKTEGISRSAAILRSLTAAMLLAGPGLVLGVTTSTGTSSPVPPRDLKLVNDHWTPWDPPVPPDGAEVYVIRKGDTLWDLAARDLDDPYLWPRIWDLNRYILDSHWIYPGDPLLLPGPVTVVAEETEPPEVDGEGDGVDGEAGTGVEVPVEAAMTPPDDPSGRPRGSVWQKPRPDDIADWSEMLCSGYIIAEPEENAFYIYASEEEHKNGLAPGDVIYLNQGLSSGVSPGDKFFVVHQEDKVVHPVYNRRVGWLFRKKGIVQVIAAQAESATAEIIEGCDTIHVGYDLIRYSDLESPKKRDTGLEHYGVEDNGNVSGYVIYSSLSQNAMGQGDIVFIDLGIADGIEKGDYLMIYRDDTTGEKFSEVLHNQSYGVGLKGFRNWRWKHRSTVQALNVREIPKGMEIPRKMLGELAVIDSNHHTATAKVMVSWREIYPGDEIQLID